MSDTLSPADRELVEAARAAIGRVYHPDRHRVGAALRLTTGEIITGVHLDATVGRMAVCAEAVALGRAITEHGSSAVSRIVAVMHAGPTGPVVCAPCGMCRELVSDYAPNAVVLMPAADGAVRLVPILELLPGKFRRH